MQVVYPFLSSGVSVLSKTTDAKTSLLNPACLNRNFR